MTLSEKENWEAMKDQILQIFPINTETEKNELKIEHRTTIGFNQEKLHLLKLLLTKKKYKEAFLSYLINNLDMPSRQILVDQIEKRLDDQLNFFLRIEKTSLSNQQALQLTSEGNCLHVKLKIAAFPKNREVAIKIVKEFLLNENIQ